MAFHTLHQTGSRAVNAQRHAASPRRSWRLWAWLLVCMVLAQTLGLMHGVAHGTHAHNALQDGPVLQARVFVPADAGWVAKVFGAHHDGSDCRLYDQSSHGDCMPAVAPLLLPSQVLPALLPPVAAAPLRAAATFFQARGPPSLR